MRHTDSRKNIAVILHNIRSVHNVGSVFRTADAAAVSEILLSGYTPAPLDAFLRKRADLAKVSLGAEDWIPWKKVPTLSYAIDSLHARGFVVAGIEQDKKASSLFTWRAPEHSPIALVLGNEVRGISSQGLKLCDVILEIPMYGKKESLNVSVAAGIALFELRRA
jgi:23S rRNA (guanosine2251-2'-O)-methyltransferase